MSELRNLLDELQSEKHFSSKKRNMLQLPQLPKQQRQHNVLRRQGRGIMHELCQRKQQHMKNILATLNTPLHPNMNPACLNQHLCPTASTNLVKPYLHNQISRLSLLHLPTSQQVFNFRITNLSPLCHLHHHHAPFKYLSYHCQCFNCLRTQCFKVRCKLIRTSNNGMGDGMVTEPLTE